MVYWSICARLSSIRPKSQMCTGAGVERQEWLVQIVGMRVTFCGVLMAQAHKTSQKSFWGCWCGNTLRCLASSDSQHQIFCWYIGNTTWMISDHHPILFKRFLRTSTRTEPLLDGEHTHEKPAEQDRLGEVDTEKASSFQVRPNEYSRVLPTEGLPLVFLHTYICIYITTDWNLECRLERPPDF